LDTDILSYFASIPALAAAIVLLTQVIRKVVTVSGSGAQYLSWGVSLVLAVVGYIGGFGIFLNVTWYAGLIYTLSAGLIANGLFDWSVVRSVLKFFKLYDGDESYELLDTK
jgi:hypothetical protein